MHAPVTYLFTDDILLNIGPGINLHDVSQPLDISQVKKAMTTKILAMKTQTEYLNKALVLAEEYLAGLELCLVASEEEAKKAEKGKGCPLDGSVSA